MLFRSLNTLKHITYTEQSPHRHDRRGPDDSRGHSGRRRGRRCPAEAANRIADEERRSVQFRAPVHWEGVRARRGARRPRPRPVEHQASGLRERDRSVLEARR